MPMLKLVVESKYTPKDSPSTSAKELLQTGFSQARQTYPENHFMCPLFVNFKKNRVQNNQTAEG